MNNYALNLSDPEGWRGTGMPPERFESVEFSIDGLSCLHQFPIWNSMPGTMCVLVREDSEILDRLKVGDVLPLKYYTSNLVCPTRYLDTEIRHITREDAGRFRGHYLVGLGIKGECPP